MKKIFCILLTLVICTVVLSGCNKIQEFYNEKDEADFKYGNVYKFEVIQLKNKMDEQTMKRLNITGSAFLFIGSLSGNYEEEKVRTLSYYGWLKDTRGGMYFAEIPFDNVRIYEDLKPGENPYFVANDEMQYVNDHNEISDWYKYNMFNLHLAPGTIIPRIDVNLDLNNIVK